MTHRAYDNVQETTASIGNGALVLAGPTHNHRAFAGAGGGNGDTFWARIEHATLSEVEQSVLCTYSAGGNSITRTFVPGVSSSSTGSLVVFSAGTKTVSLIAPANRQMLADENGLIVFNGPIARKVRIITEGTSTEMEATDSELLIQKDVSGAHAVTLPPITTVGQEAIVSDGKGDLDVGTNNITITAADGGEINGEADVVMQAAYQSLRFRAITPTDWLISA